MKLPKNKWSSTAAGEGVLFFAQLLLEMLGDDSFESFRAYSLDTPARVVEGLGVLRDIRRNRIMPQAFDPIKDELLWSLKKDVVAKDLMLEHIRLFECDVADKKTPLINYRPQLQYFSKKFDGKYKQLCEEKILATFSDSKKRIALRQIVGFYCSHLINSGYSKQYLLRRINSTFFSKPMLRVSARTLSAFFKSLDGKKRKYSVIVAIDGDFSKFLSNLNMGGSQNYAQTTSAQVQRLVATELPLPEGYGYSVVPAEGLDPDSAVSQANLLLTSIRSLGMLVPNAPERNWLPSMYVVPHRATKGTLQQSKNLPLNRGTISSSNSRRALDSVTTYASRVLANFDRVSTSRMLACLRTSGLARTSPSIENQLISMWSAIEVLLSEPPDNTPRIVHYVDTLIPLICLRYARRQFIAVYESMLVAYRRPFKDMVNQETQMAGKDQYTRFAATICLPENENIREVGYMGLTKTNPLARHRLFKLERDFSSPGGLVDTLDGHERRVRWQIHRIYRARNNLVHSGRSPSFLDSIVVNLDEFFRAAFGTIVNWASKESKRTEIDQAVAEIALQYRAFKAFLGSEAKSEAFSLEGVSRIVR